MIEAMAMVVEIAATCGPSGGLLCGGEPSEGWPLEVAPTPNTRGVVESPSIEKIKAKLQHKRREERDDARDTGHG